MQAGLEIHIIKNKSLTQKNKCTVIFNMFFNINKKS
jgi:hypothetical protein